MGFFPPSSSEKSTSLRAAAAATSRPVAVLPVNMTKSAFWTMGPPSSPPAPQTTCTSSRGKPHSRSSLTSQRAVSGVLRSGFMTAAFPAMIAGMASETASVSG